MMPTMFLRRRMKTATMPRLHLKMMMIPTAPITMMMMKI